jgi:hypothetical protein
MLTLGFRDSMGFLTPPCPFAFAALYLDVSWQLLQHCNALQDVVCGNLFKFNLNNVTQN